MVGSAAILGVLSPLSAIAPDQWNRVFEIDVSAKWRLIRRSIRCSDTRGVLFVTSSVARSARAYWAPCSVSKTALKALAKTFANEVRRHADEGEPGRSRRPCYAHARRSLSRRGPPKSGDVMEIFVRHGVPESVTGQLADPRKPLP